MSKTKSKEKLSRSETQEAARRKVQKEIAKTDKTRANELRDAVKSMQVEHDGWVDDEGREEIDVQYREAVNHLSSIFDDGDIPPNCRTMQARTMEFLIAWDAYQEVNGEPPNGLWVAYQSMVDTADRLDQVEHEVELYDIEPIAILRNPGEGRAAVSDFQIAKMWRFINRRGEFDPSLVQKEFVNPGSVTKLRGGMDGRDWVHPAIADRQKKAAAMKSKRIADRRRDDEVIDDKPKKVRQPCVETPFELYCTGVGAVQAAKMLCKPDVEVERQWLRFKAGEVPDMDADLPPVMEGEMNVDSTTADLIREYAADGEMSHEDIAAEIGCDVPVVVSVLEG